jgi:hypothetical protein
MNIPPRAVKSQAAISMTVMLVTSGLDIKISKVIITPKDVPTPKLESRTVML